MKLINFFACMFNYCLFWFLGAGGRVGGKWTAIYKNALSPQPRQ